MGEYFVKSSGAICEQGVLGAGERSYSMAEVIVYLLCNLPWLPVGIPQFLSTVFSYPVERFEHRCKKTFFEQPLLKKYPHQRNRRGGNLPPATLQ